MLEKTFWIYYILCFVKTVSYLYYVDLYKYLAMHITQNDERAQRIYGVMAILCFFARFFSGKVFNKLGIRNSFILIYSLNVVQELLYIFLGQYYEWMFFATFMFARTISSLNAYLNYAIPYAVYGTKKAIKISCYFESFYVVVISLTVVLNWIFENRGNILVLVCIFFTAELICLLYCVFFLKNRKI